MPMADKGTIEIYRSHWIVPVSRPPIEDGCIAVENGTIAYVGRFALLPSGHGNLMVHDLGPTILLPGFVNAHTHLELTGYRGLLTPAPLWQWLEQLVALRRDTDSVDREGDAISKGIAMSLAAGVTCVGDISRTGLNASVYLETLPPIRMTCFLELISGASQTPNSAPSLSKIFREQSARPWPNGCRIGLSPHAMYTVGHNDLTETTKLARAFDASLTMHLLETPDEARWLEEGSGPLSDFLNRHNLPTARDPVAGGVIERLDRAGLLSRPVLWAHVNYVTDAQIKRLAAGGGTVVWCPRAHRFFGHRKHRWEDMLAAGLNVCIGTDSAASDATLSILDELRLVRQQDPVAKTDVILEMGTVRGAAGLGLGSLIGSLEVGKRADFVSIPIDPLGTIDPVVNLLDGRQEVNKVWIDGIRYQHSHGSDT